MTGSVAHISQDSMFPTAWIRELGGLQALVPKHHLIDSLVLTTRRLRERKERPAQKALADALRAYLVGNEYDNTTYNKLHDALDQYDMVASETEIWVVHAMKDGTVAESYGPLFGRGQAINLANALNYRNKNGFSYKAVLLMEPETGS